MRKLLLFLLRKPLIWIADYFSEAPVRADVFRSLSRLYHLHKNPLINNLKRIDIDLQSKFIIFSDQHKGNTSWADDFSNNERNYIDALNFYYQNGFSFINLGDSEELWKFNAADVMKFHEGSYVAESAFHPDRYFKTFGNHDLLWKNPLDTALHLNKYFRMPLSVYEGLLLNVVGLAKPLEIFLTHGHQGDKMSDSNAFSTWVIAHLWMPLQRYLRLNINVPSKDFTLRNRHNQLMYEWASRRKNLILITGHTHKPVFASGHYKPHAGTQIEVLDEKIKPCYFNSGCCCYADGDITGIEIENGVVRLVKWFNEEVKPERMILEEIKLETLSKDL